MTLWLTIAAVAMTSAALKGIGPALIGARELPERGRDVIAHLAPALLAALVALQTFAGDDGPVDARVLGVTAAALALAARVPALAAVGLAAAVTALARTVP